MRLPWLPSVWLLLGVTVLFVAILLEECAMRSRTPPPPPPTTEAPVVIVVTSTPGQIITMSPAKPHPSPVVIDLNADRLPPRARLPTATMTPVPTETPVPPTVTRVPQTPIQKGDRDAASVVHGL